VPWHILGVPDLASWRVQGSGRGLTSPITDGSAFCRWCFPFPAGRGSQRPRCPTRECGHMRLPRASCQLARARVQISRHAAQSSCWTAVDWL